MNAFPTLRAESNILDVDKITSLEYQEERPGYISVFVNNNKYGSIIRLSSNEWNIYLGGCFQGTENTETACRYLIEDIMQ